MAHRGPGAAGITEYFPAVAAGLVLDFLVGDELLQPHPVAVFGTAMERVERALWRDDRRAGLLYEFAGLTLASTAGVVLALVPGGATAGVSTAVAARGLWAAATDVAAALEAGDLQRARRLVKALVGRDAEMLDAGGVARAAVESVAENTVDGIVAPALYGALAGPAGALGYRAVNTLDSMVGYRDARYERFGWAAARLDDLANLVPARLTALLVAAVRPRAAGEIRRGVRGDARLHPSPNAGVVEAAFAAALGLRLGGTNEYGGRSEDRPRLGPDSGRAPEAADISRAVRCSRDVTLALLCLLLPGAAAQARRTGRDRRTGRPCPTDPGSGAGQRHAS